MLLSASLHFDPQAKTVLGQQGVRGDFFAYRFRGSCYKLRILQKNVRIVIHQRQNLYPIDFFQWDIQRAHVTSFLQENIAHTGLRIALRASSEETAVMISNLARFSQRAAHLRKSVASIDKKPLENQFCTWSQRR